MAKKQPGAMLYFDVRPSLKRLSNEEKGILFEAILDYAELGVLPEVEGMLGVAWDFIQPRLDRDRERYESISAKRTEAVNQRWKQERERENEMQMNTNVCSNMQTIPTTNTPPPSKTTTLPTTTTTTTEALCASSPSLSREQIEVNDFEERRRRNMESVMNYRG